MRAVDQLLDYSGKRVVVTGAARGIGAGIAERFREAGAEVVHHERKLADVTVRAEVERFFAAAGPLHVLINNAGIYPLKPILEIDDAEWRAMIDANLTAVHLCTQAAAKRMIAEKLEGAIINITSIEAYAPAFLHAHYDAAKAGVAMYTKNAALELGPHRIRVNAVAPGLIEYPELASLWPEGVARWKAKVPLQRLGTRTDVADACLFLASEAASFVTGTTLVVDGGMMVSPMF
jgi:NAD(P)-dependent dehydrogenase (short-subunit alcohol dehydrogenase family)